MSGLPDARSTVPRMTPVPGGNGTVEAARNVSRVNRPPQPSIRSAAAADASAIAEVHVASWRGAYRGLIPDEVLDALSVTESADRWRAWVDSSLAGRPTDRDPAVTHRLLVARLHDRIVGWATFGAARDADPGPRHELAGLYVHPDAWSHGVGDSLLRAVESELRALGAADAYLWVLAGNERAIGFYERHGWRADGTEKRGDAGGARQLRELRHTRVLGRETSGAPTPR
jgi:GNAT superfamily N-acetyltransferase